MKLMHPFDFLVVFHHAEYLRIADLFDVDNPELVDTDVGKKCYDAMQKGERNSVKRASEDGRRFSRHASISGRKDRAHRP